MANARKILIKESKAVLLWQQGSKAQDRMDQDRIARKYMANGSPKLSDNSAYSGLIPPNRTDGNAQVGAFVSNVPSINALYIPTSQLEGVPAQVKVSVSGPGVVQVGAPNQFAVTLSLATGALQLTGHVNNAANVNTDPALAAFTWVGSQIFVATVSSSGLVTAVARGSCTLECRYSRAANLPFASAAPSGTEFVYATIDLTVTP
jgi:hypothetical protein